MQLGWWKITLESPGAEGETLEVLQTSALLDPDPAREVYKVVSMAGVP